MNILMVVPNFYPEIGSASHIYYDLAEEFIKMGHSVDVLTSYPRDYNLSNEHKGKHFEMNQIVEGISIHRCKSSSIRDLIFLRGVEHFLISLEYYNEYKKINNNFDVCLIYIPPLPLYYLAQRIKKRDCIPCVLNFQDFHPQELIDVGVIKNKLVIRFMEYLEKDCYKKADLISVISEGGIEYIKDRGGNEKEIVHIYNGSSTSFPSEVKGDYKESSPEFQNKFIISYCGILSPFQGLDIILDVAKCFYDYPAIHFLIVGDGMEKNHMEQRIKEESIYNVTLLPLQPRMEYFNILMSSDISLLALDSRMKAPCIPGKLMSILATGKPVISIVPSESETSKITQKGEFGFVVEPGNLSDLKSKILAIYLNEELGKVLGNNGKRFLEENMDIKKIAKQYEIAFISLKKKG